MEKESIVENIWILCNSFILFFIYNFLIFILYLALKNFFLSLLNKLDYYFLLFLFNLFQDDSLSSSSIYYFYFQSIFAQQQMTKVNLTSQLYLI